MDDGLRRRDNRREQTEHGGAGQCQAGQDPEIRRTAAGGVRVRHAVALRAARAAAGAVPCRGRGVSLVEALAPSVRTVRRGGPMLTLTRRQWLRTAGAAAAAAAALAPRPAPAADAAG